MSEIRRKLMMQAESGWKEIARITTVGTTTITFSRYYSKLGFFVVGGGGSGHGDFSNAGNSGCGGNGGCVNCYEVPMMTSSCTVTVGNGGAQAASRSNSNNGGTSSVTYNGTIYSSDGGYGGRNNAGVNDRQTNSGLGGMFVYTYAFRNYKAEMMEFATTHTAEETTKIGGSTIRGAKGEGGFLNTFDENDTNLYGAGGAGAFNTYDFEVPAQASGGDTGGGAGGYGKNNNITNQGQPGAFYGAGGGGGSFSSGHTYSQGGAGYQGIVIIYGK